MLFALSLSAQKQVIDYVDPFIGSENFGATNPGAIRPQGLMSVSPFNVMGSEMNQYDKDKRWWSAPYTHANKYFTGYSHVNLSGVGCPDMGSLLLMPISGKLEVDYHEYGSTYTNEQASPGYYSNILSKYGITTEATATLRTGVSRFTFPAGENHIILNLGEGLTNETGATVRKVSETEYEGSKLLGTFCYTQNQAVFPIYFVVKVSKQPVKSGYWKHIRQGEKWENEWNTDAGKYKIYTQYSKEMSGDNVGVYFSYDCTKDEKIEVQVGVSFVSTENARLNLLAETKGKNFDIIHSEARDAWNSDLSRILVEGGTDQQKTVFYTALYHTLIHPNILNDVNGEYPAMESSEIKTVQGNRYTVFSLWDTYRNVHQLMTLLYPDRQLAMVKTMIDMYKESGWLPKWELYGRESLTMEGDPSIPVIVDTWMKGLRDFDVKTAYEAMYKSATSPSATNILRPDNDDYMALGYVPIRAPFDNSVSHALEYYIADWSLGQLASALGKTADAELFHKRSLGYKNYYSKDFGTFRPKNADGTFYEPFDPLLGANFEPNPGFHEGNAWNYTFAIPYDVPGLIKLMGGNKNFTQKLQSVFDNGYFDITNEPDIIYPYLFTNIKGEEWRTQYQVRRLLDKHYTTKPDGIPGNDDTGTMSAWAVFSMMGIYPDCPGQPSYALTSPVFDRITIKLDERYWKQKELIIEADRGKPEDIYIKDIRLNGKLFKTYKISHEDLINAGKITFTLISRK
jgi:predicted alpha-1,2-mannosidase